MTQRPEPPANSFARPKRKTNGLNEFKRYQNRYPMYVVLNAVLSLLFIDYAEFYSAPQVEQ